MARPPSGLASRPGQARMARWAPTRRLARLTGLAVRLAASQAEPSQNKGWQDWLATQIPKVFLAAEIMTGQSFSENVFATQILPAKIQIGWTSTPGRHKSTAFIGGHTHQLGCSQKHANNGSQRWTPGLSHTCLPFISQFCDSKYST